MFLCLLFFNKSFKEFRNVRFLEEFLLFSTDTNFLFLSVGNFFVLILLFSWKVSCCRGTLATSFSEEETTGSSILWLLLEFPFWCFIVGTFLDFFKYLLRIRDLVLFLVSTFLSMGSKVRSLSFGGFFSLTKLMRSWTFPFLFRLSTVIFLLFLAMSALSLVSSRPEWSLTGKYWKWPRLRARQMVEQSRHERRCMAELCRVLF